MKQQAASYSARRAALLLHLLWVAAVVLFYGAQASTCALGLNSGTINLPEPYQITYNPATSVRLAGT